MQGYDDAIADAEPTWMDIAGSLLCGAGSGASAGYQVNRFLNESGWGKQIKGWFEK